jgi:hypothetical protein
VLDAEDLRRLPATARSVHCTGARADDVCAQLPRLLQLERFGYARGLDAAWQLRPGLPRVLAAVASLGTVRRLWLDASLLTDACVEPLASMTDLEELELCIELATQTRETRAVADDLTLLTTRYDDQARLDAIAPALPRLQRLRRIRLFHCVDTHAVIAVLPRTRVAELAVERSRVALADLQQLAALPSLRELTIGDRAAAPAAADDVVRAFSGLHQLQRLTLHAAEPDDVQVRALQQALPGCKVTVVVQREKADPFTFSISR